MTQGNLFRVTVDVIPDLRVLCLTASVAILTGILFGIAPAWRSSREDPPNVLQQNAPSLSSGVGKLSKALLITHVSLPLILLGGAGLFVRTFQRICPLAVGSQDYNLLPIHFYR